MGFGRVFLIGFAAVMLVGLGVLVGGGSGGVNEPDYYHPVGVAATVAGRPHAAVGEQDNAASDPQNQQQQQPSNSNNNNHQPEPTDDPARAPMYTLAPKGEARPGEWNGIRMLVNTHMYDNVRINRTNVTLEPISINLRARTVKIVRRLRLLYPLVKDGLAPTARKVWIDVGARFFFKGSTQWFTKRYPDSSDFEVVLFDVLDLSDTYPDAIKKHFKKFEFLQKAVWVHDRGVEVKGKKMAHVKEKGKDDPHAVAIANDKRNTWTIDSVDLAAWLRARYTAEDFVVLKMDIEGGEWEVLAHLIDTGAIALVDELMLECHPRVHLPSVKYMHQSCIDLVNHFRTMNVAAHRWV